MIKERHCLITASTPDKKKSRDQSYGSMMRRGDALTETSTLPQGSNRNTSHLTCDPSKAANNGLFYRDDDDDLDVDDDDDKGLRTTKYEPTVEAARRQSQATARWVEAV